MKEQLNALVANQLEELDPNSQQAIMMGALFIGLNLLLMISVGLYWINPSFHQYISGSPL